MKKSMVADDGGKKKSVIALCSMIVRHPKTAFTTFLSVQTCSLTLTILLHMTGSTVFPADFTDVPLQLAEDETFRRVVAWNMRNEDPQEAIYRPSFTDKSLNRREPADFLELYYEAPDGNILQADHLRVIAEFEDSLLRLPHYEEFCVLKEDSSCLGIQSLLSMVQKKSCKKTNSLHNCSLFDDKHIAQQLETLSKNQHSLPMLKDFISKKADLDVYPIKAESIRSYMLIAWAIHENKNYSGPNNTKDYASQIIGPKLWKQSVLGLEKYGVKVNFYFYNSFLYYDRLRIQVISDLMLAIGSFCFVFLFLWIHTKSLFITSMGFFGILTNFFAANLVYRYVFDFRYFGVFNILSVFIILGIGVDDIFVFSDAWSATAHKNYSNLELRLSDAYRKSALSMFISSFTTTAAFIVNACSPLLAISSFGLFSACLIVVNYVSVITFFPAVVVFHHLKLRPIHCCGCCCPKCQPINSVVSPPPPTKSGQSQEKAEAINSTKVSRTICSWYSGLVFQPAVQAVFLMGLAGGLGFLSYSATRLEVDSNPVRLYVDSHPFGKSLAKRDKEFRLPRYFRDLQFSQLFFVWGIKDLDRSMCHKTDWKECRGNVVWDDYFDLNPYRAQRDLLWFCQYLKSLHKRELVRLRVKTTDKKADVNCFIEEMDSFFEAEFKRLLYTTRKMTGLPATDVKIEGLMMNHPHLYNISSINQNPYFNRFFETAMLYWLHDGYRFLSQSSFFPRNLQRVKSAEFLKQLQKKQQEAVEKLRTLQAATPVVFKRFGSLVGHSLNSSDLQRTTIFGNVSVMYGTKLRFAAVVVNTTLPVFAGYEEALPVLNEWEKLFAKAKLRMAPSLQGGFFATPDRNDFGSGMHHWLKVQQTLTQSALRGVLISLGLALPVLVLSTNDLVLGCLATFMICCTSVSVIGIVPLAGWKLGVLESLNLTLVVGLAIDYIVHVAEAYHLSPKRSRREKVAEVLHQAGISVMAGAISTLGSSLFMLFADIAFFMQFGLFIFCTVGFSLFYSMGMFTVLLALVGPESDKFSVTRLLRKATGAFFVGGDHPKIQQNDGSTSPILSADPSLLAAYIVSSSEAHKSYLDESQKLEDRPETRRSRAKSIDDDNLSSGYDTTGSVLQGSSARHQTMQPVMSDITLSDFSDLDDVLSPSQKMTLQLGGAETDNVNDSGFETGGSLTQTVLKRKHATHNQITPIPEETSADGGRTHKASDVAMTSYRFKDYDFQKARDDQNQHSYIKKHKRSHRACTPADNTTTHDHDK